MEEDLFFDVPDVISEIAVSSRGPRHVQLQWRLPRDNSRPVLRYQARSQPWTLGSKHGPLPSQDSDGFTSNGPGAATLHDVSAAEAECGKPGYASCKLPAPKVERAVLPESVLERHLPMAAWVSLRAANVEGWSEWATPILTLFRDPALGEETEREEQPLCESVIYSWGLGEDGRLGRGLEAVERGVCAETNAAVEAQLRGRRLVDLALGSHSAAVTTEDELLVWGTFLADMEDAGEDDTADSAEAAWSEVDMLVEPAHQPTSFPVHAVACGRFATAAISADGQIYAWGPNEAFQCGVRGRQVLKSVCHVRVPNDVPVVSVHLGEFHGLALTAEGGALAWGMEQGPEVALSNGNESALGGLVPQRAAMNQPQPRHLDLPRPVLAVATGAYHSALITDDGCLWTWGSNEYGQLGLGLAPSALGTATRPRPVDHFGREGRTKAAKLSLGGFHTAVIDTDRRIFTFGDNRRGQCGQGEVQQLLSPVLLQLCLPSSASSGSTCASCLGVSCGGFFSLIEAAPEPDADLCSTGPMLLACGWGKEGCLGFGQPCKRMLRPRLMPAPSACFDGGRRVARWVCMRTGMVHVAGLVLGDTIGADSVRNDQLHQDSAGE
ncbi:unnamed protein product [Polarella glacialis]|uniref:RCC1-like domain-containing protein n=1 Tax=Polarella glacialis TaxID=89957 RepID=A0A813DI29_POLGL|nr:unnamed protein product [Polarella glacialis]